MKSLKYMSIFALVAGLTACSQYDEPNPTIPVTPQETVMNAAGVKVESTSYADPLPDGSLNTIDLGAYSKLGFDVPMATVTVDNELFPADYSLRAVAYLADNAQFNNAQTFNITPNKEGQLALSSEEMQAAFEQLFGRKKDAYEVWMRYAVYADSETIQNIRLSHNGSVWYAEQHFMLQPIPPSFVVEEAYYLLGTVNGWSVATAVKLDHSGKDVYDDPNFTGVFDISDADAAAGWWWKIVPESTYVTGAWSAEDDSQFGPEVNGDESLSGKLVGKLDGEDPGAGCIKQAGRFVLHINIENLTFEWTPAYANIDATGNPTWDPTAPLGVLGANASFTYYQGIAQLDGEFKFTQGGSWTVNWGAGINPGELAFNVQTNLNPGLAAGLYPVVMSPIFLTYEVVDFPINTLNLVGGFNGWDEKNAPALTPNADRTVWTVSGISIDADTEFKICANNSWDWSIGGKDGSTTDLVFKSSVDSNPGNFKAPNAGTTVVLDFTTAPASVTVR